MNLFEYGKWRNLETFLIEKLGNLETLNVERGEILKRLNVENLERLNLGICKNSVSIKCRTFLKLS